MFYWVRRPGSMHVGAMPKSLGCNTPCTTGAVPGAFRVQCPNVARVQCPITGVPGYENGIWQACEGVFQGKQARRITLANVLALLSRMYSLLKISTYGDDASSARRDSAIKIQ